VEPGDLKPGVAAEKAAGFDDDPVATGVGHGRYYPLRHPPLFRPPFIETNGIT